MSGLVDFVFGGDKPDTSGINYQAVESAKLGRDAFEWFKDFTQETKPQRDQAAADASAVAKGQLATMATQNELAKDYADYNRSTFRPLEQRMVSEAPAYDTPERRNAEADRAVADVTMQAARAREATRAELGSYGIAPDAMKSQALMASGDINTARMAAGAASGARRQVEATGYARMADAANLGRNLPSAQATAVSTGTQAGNSAVNAGNASLNATTSGAGLMQTGFNTALAGSGQAGQLYGRVADIESASRGQDLGFLSSVYGSYTKIPSDPKVKKDRKPESPTASMAALRETPIESWKYDTAKGGPEDGGQTRIGPMADAANETMGDEVAPGGKLLDVASMVSVIGNAVKDIDKRLVRMEQRKAA